MWHWEWERRRRAGEPEAQVGRVSIGGVETAAELGGERRWLRLCVPGPLRWRPAVGDEVLVLKTGEGEAPCVLGVVQEEELRPGQVCLRGEEIELTGRVLVNGEELEELVRRLVKEEKSDG